jgi:O-acetyl-ADP-ribose deacetylase (regulator of RNase III)
VLKSQKKQIGEVAVLKNGDAYVYYLITKELYRHKPTYKRLELALTDMKKHAVEHGVKCIHMPRIGCGLDKLNWEQVRFMIESVFGDDLDAIVYRLDQ